MLTLGHILFPVDFSERCAAVAPFVKAMASRFNARVTLLSAIPPLWQTAIAEPGAAFFDLEEMKGNLQARLDGAFLRELEGVPVQRVVDVGDPAWVITEFAHSKQVDLIMMATHGYGPFRSLLLGSVAAKVLHDARCPVWTAAHAEDPNLRTHVPGRSVLCAVDAKPENAGLLSWAADYTNAVGGSLRAVHAVSGIEGWPERQLNKEFEEALRVHAQEQLQKLMADARVNAPLCVAVGEVAAVVREEARRHNADLVVIGRGALHEKLGRLRTLSYGIIRHAPCPVLSV